MTKGIIIFLSLLNIYIYKLKRSKIKRSVIYRNDDECLVEMLIDEKKKKKREKMEEKKKKN